ncbi:hypothetical protein [Clostridium saccharobutylicum]|nr:hypothetical protein [Clostridium saccharobutylicum]
MTDNISAHGPAYRTPKTPRNLGKIIISGTINKVCLHNVSIIAFIGCPIA